MTAERTRERLAALDTPTLSDALDALGLPSGVGGFTQFGAHRRIVGPARTVRLATDDGVARSRHLCTSAIEESVPGAVIVVEHHDRDDAAGWGGLLTAAAIEVGVAGVVVDGACRDVDDHVSFDFPVFARRAVPATARRRVVEVDTGSPVVIGGATVRPDDWIVADRSGVVVIPVDFVETALDQAERIQQRERLMVADLRGGARVTEVLGRDYEDMLVRGTGTTGTAT
jgi:4-hydroxy-4-methyl-2-oxoglutarate aldolase